MTHLLSLSLHFSTAGSHVSSKKDNEEVVVKSKSKNGRRSLAIPQYLLAGKSKSGTLAPLEREQSLEHKSSNNSGTSWSSMGQQQQEDVFQDTGALGAYGMHKRCI